MRQSEYTTYYERKGNVKFPVRGKLYMRHRGRAFYLRNGVLTDGLTGMCFTHSPKNMKKQEIIAALDASWLVILEKHKRIAKTEWRSKRGDVITVNGKVVNPKPAVKNIRF